MIYIIRRKGCIKKNNSTPASFPPVTVKKLLHFIAYEFSISSVPTFDNGID